MGMRLKLEKVLRMNTTPPSSPGRPKLSTALQGDISSPRARTAAAMETPRAAAGEGPPVRKENAGSLGRAIPAAMRAAPPAARNHCRGPRTPMINSAMGSRIAPAAIRSAETDFLPIPLMYFSASSTALSAFSRSPAAIGSPASSSFTVMSRAAASAGSREMSGKPRPVSQRETALSVTPTAPARSSWVIFFPRRRAAINVPVLCGSICIPPPHQHNMKARLCHSIVRRAEI